MVLGEKQNQKISLMLQDIYMANKRVQVDRNP